MNTTLLFDGNNLAMRSIHAARYSQMSAEGVNTGPLTIFINSLVKIVQDEQPGRIGVAWDGFSKLRGQLIEGYKANRVTAPEIADLKGDTFALIIQLLRLLKIEQARLADYEADDVIAGWWQKIQPEHASKIVIVSADKDFLQLVGPNHHGVPTELLRLSSGDAATDRWDEARVIEELGHTPAQWPLIASLTGDKVDNVPGIPGIGPKKALKLLQKYDWNPVGAAMQEHPDHVMKVRDSLLAVDLREPEASLDVPVPQPFDLNTPLTPELTGFLDAYRLSSLKGKLAVGSLWQAKGSALPGRPFQLRLPSA